MISWTLSSQILTFEDQLNISSESVTVSKNELKVFAILLCSVENLPFSLNVIFSSAIECLFEKYGLQLFQNVFEFFSGFNLSKWSFLHDCLVLLNGFFAFYSLCVAFWVLFALFLSCDLFITALRSVLFTWSFWLHRNV